MKAAISRVFGSHCQEEKLQRMRKRFKMLSCQAADINMEVEYEEIQPHKKRKRAVDFWLTSFEELKAKVQRIEHDVRDEASSSHLASSDPLEKLSREIEELLDQRKFLGNLVLNRPAVSGPPLVTTQLKGQKFEEAQLRILASLKNSKISTIGVYGVGGIGKTALLMHVHNALLEQFQDLDREDKDFMYPRRVYWVAVGQDCTVSKLQQKIIGAMGLNYVMGEDDEKKRAARLSEELKNGKETVLFLDNMWEHVSVDDIGLPVGAEGFKFILSTRNIEVCRRMQCHQSLKVEPLPREEAWTFFSEMLSIYEELPVEAQHIAKEVADECAGLPLGIKVMATSTRVFSDIHSWRNLLEELRTSKKGDPDMENDVLQVLKTSYDYLKDVKLQQCFLLCSLFPEDYPISRDELILLMLSVGLLEGLKKRQEQLDKGHAMLNKLENLCLLEAVTDLHHVRCVKMHDLVRDMAIQIARDDHHWLIEAGMRLKEALVDLQWEENLKMVSLMSNCISEIPSAVSPRCPHLSVLLLQHNPVNTIPDSFLYHLKTLTLLNISHTGIEKLPDAVSQLENLTALVVRCCWRLKYIPSMAPLKKLRDLDLSFCGALRDIRQGLEGLVDLKSLNLKGTDRLSHSIQGLLSKLTSIQCLKLDYNASGILGEHVQKLKHLERIEGWCTPHLSNFNRFINSLHYKKLNFYEFIVGSGQFIRFLHEIEDDILCILEKNIRLFNVSISGEREVVELPQNMQHLQIQQCDFAGGTLLDSLPSINGSTWLTRIWIGRCKGLNFICPSSPRYSEPEGETFRQVASVDTQLESLRELILWDLPDIRGLIEEGCKLAPKAFTNLKKLSVTCCPNIKSLINLNHLRSLEEIKIEECIELEELVAPSDSTVDISTNIHGYRGEDTDTDHGNIYMSLPNLRVLKLLYLPKLKSICSSGQLIRCDKITEIEISLCSKLQSFPLSLPLNSDKKRSPPPYLQEIIADKMWWKSLEWNHLQVKQILQPYVKLKEPFDLEINF